MRKLTTYGIAVTLVLAALNGIVWLVGNPPRMHGVHVFSAGFILGMLGMYILAWVNGYRQARGG
jgi:hypothetical protein